MKTISFFILFESPCNSGPNAEKNGSNRIRFTFYQYLSTYSVLRQVLVMEHFHTTFNFLCTDCQKRCPRFIGEICASDNNTYWNKCTFEIAKCEAKLYGVTLTVKNNGPCNSKHPGNYLTRIVLGGRLFILMTVTSSSSSVPPL